MQQERSQRSSKYRLEAGGKTFSFLCTMVVLVVVVSIIYMVTSKGLATFFVNKINPVDFFFSADWNPGKTDAYGKPLVGALPMIVGSFAVTVMSTLFATPIAIAASIFCVEYNPKLGKRIIQPAIELLVGVPSVVFGLIGLEVLIPIIRNVHGGTGFGIFAASLVLTFMVLPTITSISISALQNVSPAQKEGALALGASRWQMIYKVSLHNAKTGILTGVVLGMARAFGEALAVQMVIGNTAVLPKSLFTSASTLTSILTMNMGNTIQGQLENNVLWSLAMVLLLMSLFFIIIIHRIGRKSE